MMKFLDSLHFSRNTVVSFSTRCMYTKLIMSIEGSIDLRGLLDADCRSLRTLALSLISPVEFEARRD